MDQEQFLVQSRTINVNMMPGQRGSQAPKEKIPGPPVFS
jgi:hypothetical protein